MKTAAGGKPEPLFPLLMPFLEKLGIDAMQDKEKFINQWFSYLNEGLALLKAKKSPSCGVVTKTIIECIFYLCNKCDLPQTVKSNLINDHLITIVTEESLGRNIASCLLDYLMFWNRSAGGNTEIAQCNQYFWSSLHYICTQVYNVNLSFVQLLASYFKHLPAVILSRYLFGEKSRFFFIVIGINLKIFKI